MGRKELRGESWLSSFEKKVEKTSNCWLWKGAKAYNGYGVCLWKGIQTGAHRASYEYFKGEIPKELEVHHTCKNRSCVNPEHMKLLTHGQHMILNRKQFCPRGHKREFPWRSYCRECDRLRAFNEAKWHRVPGHFKCGHKISASNTTYSHRKRQCRMCRNKFRRELYARKKAVKL